MTPVLVAFLALFALQHLVAWTLALLGLRRAARRGAEVPAALAAHVDRPTALRSRDYTLARGRLGLAASLGGAAFTLVALLSGALPALDAALGRLGLGGASRFVVFLLALAAASGLAGVPFSLWSTFGVEARFGFNRTTPGLWIRDRLKGLLLAAALGVPLLYAAHAFFERTGPAWWLWLFFFTAGVQLGLAVVWPSLIAPIFHRYRPLPDGELRERLQDLCRRAGFRTGGLFTIDGSRRSGHSNAFFAGLWRPRIVLYDTLLEATPADETAAVLAHEIGHYRSHHVLKGLALGLLGQAAALLALSWLATWPALFQAFGFAAPAFHALLALAALGGGAFTFFLSPLGAWLSRRNELQADRYAVHLTGCGPALASALLRLSHDNLAPLQPHPWALAWYATHPTTARRLEAIGRLAGAADAPGRAQPGSRGT